MCSSTALKVSAKFDQKPSYADNVADQLRDEVGIEVEVEPTGDQEIQDLQNLDKQALVEMLMRAKGALGGKVPSPPATPSTPAAGSNSGVPVAVQAPSYPYLKYSLPPLRPMPNPGPRSTNESSSAVKNDESNKENKNPSWDTQQNSNNNNSTWEAPANTTTSNDQWNVSGGSGWDGQANGQDPITRQHSQGPVIQTLPNDDPTNDTIPPRPAPPPPDEWAQPIDTTQQQDTVDNWDKGYEGNTGGNGWNTSSSGTQGVTSW